MERQPEPEIMDIPEEADAYAQADFSTVNQAFADRLIELAGPCSSALAIDLGTGPGDIPRRIQAARPQWRILGLDAAWPMLRIAQTENLKARGRVPAWTVTDAKSLPLSDGSIDVVFSNSILHHLSDPTPFWKEIRRIIRPGGLVFLRDLTRPDAAEDARAIVQQYAGSESLLLQEEYYRSLLAAYTVAEVQTQLEHADLHTLQVVKVTDRHIDIFGRV